MPEKIRHLVVDSPRLGSGNEYKVAGVDSINHEKNDGDVCGIPSGAFFGWQTPKGEVMQSFIDTARDEYGFHFREGLEIRELAEDCVIERKITSYGKLFKSMLKQFYNPGDILKFLTTQVNWQLLPRPRIKRYADFVRIEKHSDKPCMKMSDLADPYWGPKLRDFLQNQCEPMYREKGFMADPLGGAAITGAIKFLFNPTADIPLSNLEKGDNGEIITTDAGMIRAHEAENIYRMPGTSEPMRIALRSLIVLSYEAMNMAVRDYGWGLEPREWNRWNTAPKVAAAVGYSGVRLARGFWRSKISQIWEGLSCLS